MPALKYWDAATSSWKVGAVGPASGQVYQQIIGDGAASSFDVTHGFGTRAVTVTVYRNTPPYAEVDAEVERVTTSMVTVRTTPTVPGVGEFVVAIAAAGTQATLDVTMDVWHEVGAAGEPAITHAGWAQGSTGFKLAFKKQPDGRVVMRGWLSVIGAWTYGSTIFTLPVGYRPPSNRYFNLQFWDSDGSRDVVILQILSTGAVQIGGALAGTAPTGGATSQATFDGIEFDTESVLQVASNFAQPIDVWHTVGAAGEPAFNASYSNVVGQTALQFRKRPDGKVLLRGYINTVAAGGAVFTLPAGYRPPGTVRFHTNAQNAATAQVTALVYVLPDGTVNVHGTNSPVIADVSPVEFDTDTVGAYVMGAIGRPRVTALTAGQQGIPSPIPDGFEVVYVADATNGILWTLKYNAGSASAYKWEVIGGSDLFALVASASTTTSATYADLAAGAGPDVTVPLAGDYDVQIGASVGNNAVGQEAFMSYAIGGTAASDVDMVQYFPAETSSKRHSVAGQRRKTAIAAATLLRAKYRVGGGTGMWQDRWMRVRPVRVG